MMGADGRNCERIWETIQALVENRSPTVIPAKSAEVRDSLET